MTTFKLLNKDDILSLGTKVRVYDEDEKLQLYCYSECDENETSMLKQCRGVVFNDDKLIMQGFPYMSEYPFNDIDKVEKIKNIDKYNIYKMYEGTILRVFFHENWYISTHCKLDAFRSKWSCKDSFGVLFQNCIKFFYDKENIVFDSLEKYQEHFLSTLYKEKQYMFFIRNNKENRVVCNDYTESKNNIPMFHVGTFKQNKFFTEDEKVDKIPFLEKLDINNVDDIKTYMDNNNYKETPGILCIRKEDTNDYLDIFKIVEPKYIEFSKIRGNEPSVKYRYLQVRMSRTFNLKMRELYPNYVKDFDNYENIILSIAKNIYNAYINRFIKHMYVFIPKEQFFIMKECHMWHLKDKKQNIISLQQILIIINQKEPTVLNYLIKNYTHNKNISLDIENVRPPSFISPQLSSLSITPPPPPPSPLLLAKSYKDILKK